MAPHITIIGFQRREFLDVLRTLTRVSTGHRLIHFATIDEALRANPADISDADLVIVLQSSSDQHARDAVNTLIGRTIFGRLLCCYGPWCESDGRTRDLWPDAARIPVRLASAQIEAELRDCKAGEAPIPVTASRDEVFGHRLGIDEGQRSIDAPKLVNAAVIGPDRVFRRILAQNLADIGIRSVNLPLIQTPLNKTVPAKETSRGPVHLVIHDLDPWCALTDVSLKAAHAMFPVATIWGIASMPDAGLTTEIADSKLQRVIPKLDMQLGLRWHVQQWSRAEQTEEIRLFDAS